MNHKKRQRKVLVIIVGFAATCFVIAYAVTVGGHMEYKRHDEVLASEGLPLAVAHAVQFGDVNPSQFRLNSKELIVSGIRQRPPEDPGRTVWLYSDDETVRTQFAIYFDHPEHWQFSQAVALPTAATMTLFYFDDNGVLEKTVRVEVYFINIMSK